MLKLHKENSLRPLSFLMHFMYSCYALNWHDTLPISNATQAILLCTMYNFEKKYLSIFLPRKFSCVIVLHNILSIANSKQRDITIWTEIKIKQAEKKYVNMFHMSTVAAYINQLNRLLLWYGWLAIWISDCDW